MGYMAEALIAVGLFLNLTLSHASCGHPNSAVFQIQPISATVFEGDDAVFICVVANFTPKSDSLTWKVYPKLYDTSIAHSYDKVARKKTTVLTVFNIRRVSQNHQCIINSLDNGLNLRTCYSSVASINVHYFPRKNEITCGPQRPGIFREGDIVPIWCTVEKGNPTLNLTWSVDGSPVSSFQSCDDKDVSSFKISHQFNIRHTLNSKSLKCIGISTIIFPGREVSCVIGPFAVHFKPQITVHPLVQTFDISDNISGTLQLSCIIESYPEISALTWSCSPSHILLGCIGATDETLTFIISKDVQRFMSNAMNLTVTATCSAYNSLGNSSAESEIIIQREKHYHIDGSSSISATGTNMVSSLPTYCDNATVHLNSTNASMRSALETNEASFFCVAECNTPNKMYLTVGDWSLNGTTLTNDIDSHIKSDVAPDLSSVLTLRNITSLFTMKRTIVITCSTRINTGTVTQRLHFPEEPITVRTATSEYTRFGGNRPPSNGKAQKRNRYYTSSEWAFRTTTSVNEYGVEKGKDLENDNLGGSRMIIIIFSVLGCVLITSLLCTICTANLFRFMQSINPSNSTILGGKISNESTVFNNEDLRQSTASVANDGIYEEPVTIPSPLITVHKSSFVRNDLTFAANPVDVFDKEVSYYSDSIFNTSRLSLNSLSSSKDSNDYSEISVLSTASDWDDRSTSSPTPLTPSFSIDNSSLPEYGYNGYGKQLKVKMDKIGLPRSMSLGQLRMLEYRKPLNDQLSHDTEHDIAANSY